MKSVTLLRNLGLELPSNRVKQLFSCKTLKEKSHIMLSSLFKIKPKVLRNQFVQVFVATELF